MRKEGYLGKLRNILVTFIIFLSFLFYISIELIADENNSSKNSINNSSSSSSDNFQNSLTGQGEVPFEIFLGRKLYSEGEYEKASELLKSAVDRKEASADDTALLGICYIKLNKKDRAEEILNRALKIDKNSFAVYMGLGTLSFEKKDFNGAFEYFSHAHRLRKESIQAVKGMSASLINLGVTEYAKGNKKKAEDTFKRALKLEPESVPALRNLGIVYSDTDRDKKAVKAYKEALKISPNDPVVLRLLSEVLEKQGAEDELFGILKKLSVVQPYNPYSYEKLGLIYDRRGETGKAIDAFLKALKYGSEEPYPYFRVAKYFFKSGDKKKAHSNLILAIGRSVYRIGALELKAAGRIKQKKGKLNKGDIEKLKSYSSLIEKPQKILEDSIEMIREIDSSNDIFKKDIEKLSSWYPHNAVLKEALAGVLEEGAKYSDALKVWKALAEDHPTRAKAHIGIAGIYEKTGRTDNAMLEYRRALDLDSTNESIFEDLYSLYKKNGKEKELFSLLKDRYLRDKRNTVLLKYLILLAKDTGSGKDTDYFKKELNRISSEKP